MIVMDVTETTPITIPLDDTVGIKRIVMISTGNGSVALSLNDDVAILIATEANIIDFTFPETPYGYPAPSCFFLKMTGPGSARIMMETSPFMNTDYFEIKGEIT
nr:MAG TPA: hypothetical protein [Caudoviricetes sp.]